MNKKTLLNYVLIFLIVYLVLGIIFPKNEEKQTEKAPIQIETTSKSYEENALVTINIKNNTKDTITVKNNCPSPILKIEKKENGKWKQINTQTNAQCTKTNYEIKPDKEQKIIFTHWNHSIFGDLGTYKITAEITQNNETKQLDSNEFEITPQGWFGTIWTKGLYQPIYNILILIISLIPGNDLGLAIIILTLIIRTILLIPAHKSMKSQRKMQELQPKLNALKEKHKNDQETLAKETMLLWKEHKVNPFSSCLPLFIQLPFLIAIFYVIKDGISPDNTYLLYPQLTSFNLSTINTNFLGILDLTKVNTIILPIIVGGFQFIQMKLAMAKSKDKNITNKKHSKTKDELATANKVMIYFMPVMIALFTASVPAGVGLYWVSSTIYGIFQQLIVNKQINEENVKIKVKTVKEPNNQSTKKDNKNTKKKHNKKHKSKKK